MNIPPSSFGYVDVIGTAGTLIVVAAYFGTQMRLINSDDLVFPVLNLAGSVLIGFSLFHNFNLASALMEFFWIAISLLGIFRAFFGSAQKTANHPTASSNNEC